MSTTRRGFLGVLASLVAIPQVVVEACERAVRYVRRPKIGRDEFSALLAEGIDSLWENDPGPWQRYGEPDARVKSARYFSRGDDPDGLELDIKYDTLPDGYYATKDGALRVKSARADFELRLDRGAEWRHANYCPPCQMNYHGYCKHAQHGDHGCQCYHTGRNS